MTLAIIDARGPRYVVLDAGSALTGALVKQAKESELAAAASAANAEAFTGPTYASQALGEAGTTTGQYFAVNAAGIVSIYLRTGGGSTLERTMLTTPALAASGGSALVGFLQAGTGAVARNSRDKQREILSIDDFGADPTGSTNSLPALLLAIAAAPHGGTIYFPGTYRFSGTVGAIACVISKPLTFRGPGHRITNVPSNVLARGFLFFDNAVSTGIYVDDTQLTLEGVTISGVGAGTSWGIRVVGANSALRMTSDSIIQGFNTGISLEGSDYSKIDRSTVSYCTNAITANDAFNLDIFEAHLRPEGSSSQGLVLLNGSQATIVGGAIESYELAGILLAGGSRVKTFGVYFEGNVAVPTAWNFYLLDNCSVDETASHVYMTGCQRHISTDGLSTAGVTVISRSNFFIPDPSARVVDYYRVNPALATNTLHVDDHRFRPGDTVGANNRFLSADYAPSSIAQGVGDVVFNFPLGHASYGKGYNTRLDVIDPAQASLGTPKNLTAAGFIAAAADSDPIGIRTAYGPNAPYRAVYQNGQWEKIGLRMANQTDASGGATVDAEARTAINGLLAKLRSAGVMI